MTLLFRAFVSWTWIAALPAADDSLRDLLQATARGAASLRAFFSSSGSPKPRLLQDRDEHGFCALAVASYNGDAEAVQLLLDKGAVVKPGELRVSMGGSTAAVSSVVELIVRRSSMLIMLGSGFELPAYLRSVQKHLITSRSPSQSESDVPDIARTLELVTFNGQARPTEKSQEEGSDIARAAYFLDAGVVDVLARLHMADIGQSSQKKKKYHFGMGRALIACVLGVGQLKHRLNRALMQMPQMAGRLFREYYGFEVAPEQELIDPNFHSVSFEDTWRTVGGKATRTAKSLLEGRADPSFRQSPQSKKTPLHHCAEHGLVSIAELLLRARGDPNAASMPLQRTPLHLAVVHRSTGVLKALVAARAEVHRTDGAGRNAIDIARLLRWEEGQKLLGVASTLRLSQHGIPEVMRVTELLPTGWMSRWQRGEMHPAWSDSGDECGLDTIDVSDLTASKFLVDHLSLRRPLRIRGGAEYMPALERWKNLRYLKRKVGSTMLTAVTIPYPEDFGDRDARDTRRVTLNEYIDNVMGKVNSSSGTPLYAFLVVERDNTAFKKLTALIDKDATPHPKWLAQEADAKSRVRFGNVQFALGPAGSGAPQHYHTHSYSSLFAGRKRWWYFPPPTSALSRKHAWRFAEDDAKTRKGLNATSPPQSLPLVCDQLPGDIMYVPTDWGHLTLNLEATVALAREFTWDGEETDSRVINSLMV